MDDGVAYPLLLARRHAADGDRRTRPAQLRRRPRSRRPLCARPRGNQKNFRTTVQQLVRECLHPRRAFGTGPAAADVPAAGGTPPLGTRCLHHRSRSGKLSGHVPQPRRPGYVAAGRLPALSQSHPNRRAQQHPAPRDRNRTLHRPHRGCANLSVARGSHRRRGCPDCSTAIWSTVSEPPAV